MNEYLFHLKKSVEMYKQLCADEFYNTDLNNDKLIQEEFAYFEELLLVINKSPPKYYVKLLKIIEDDEDKIKSIEYEYYDNMSEILDTSFVIIKDSSK